MSALFRSEAITKHRNRLSGDVAIAAGTAWAPHVSAGFLALAATSFLFGSASAAFGD